MYGRLIKIAILLIHLALGFNSIMPKMSITPVVVTLENPVNGHHSVTVLIPRIHSHLMRPVETPITITIGANK